MLLLFKLLRLPPELQSRLFVLVLQAHAGDQLPVGQGVLQGGEHHLVDALPIPEPQLHLGGVDVHIQKLRLDLKVQQGEGVFVLHHKGAVGLLDGLGDDSALDVAAVDIVILVVAVAPGDDGLSDKAPEPHRSALRLHGEEV